MERVTYENIINVRPVLETLATERMPGRTSLKLARIARQIFDALDDFQKMRDDLLTTYAEHDDLGKVVKDDDGNIVWSDLEKFEEEMRAALKLPVDGLDYSPILLKHWPKNRELEPRESLALFEAGIITE